MRNSDATRPRDGRRARRPPQRARHRRPRSGPAAGPRLQVCVLRSVLARAARGPALAPAGNQSSGCRVLARRSAAPACAPPRCGVSSPRGVSSPPPPPGGRSPVAGRSAADRALRRAVGGVGGRRLFLAKRGARGSDARLRRLTRTHAHTHSNAHTHTCSSLILMNRGAQGSDRRRGGGGGDCHETVVEPVAHR